MTNENTPDKPEEPTCRCGGTLKCNYSGLWVCTECKQSCNLSGRLSIPDPPDSFEHLKPISRNHLDHLFGFPDAGEEYVQYSETDWRIWETINSIEQRILEKHPEWADDPYGHAFLAGDNERRDEGS